MLFLQKYLSSRYYVASKQVRMYYRSGTGIRCCIGAAEQQTLRFHLPSGSTFLREMTSWPPF